jgi:hypothetical protein
LFYLRSQASLVGMPDDEPLHPASPDHVADALAFALRFNGRKRVHHGDQFMAKITAERLIEHLERSGFVVMKKPPGKPPTAG